MQPGARIAVLLAAAMTAAPAQAQSNLISQPVQVGDEAIRYTRGQASVIDHADTGSIQVRPAPMDHGSLVYGVAVLNTGRVPANVDVSNFSLIVNGKTYRAFTVTELTSRAKNRATWSKIGLGLLGGLAAGAAAAQRDTYVGTFRTPRATYTSVYTTPSISGQIAAGATIGATTAGLYAIQNALDQTLDALNEDVIQLTTVDPGESYGGAVFFEKVSIPKLPAEAEFVADWNGHEYRLKFQIAKPGTPAPPFRPVELPPPPPPIARMAPPVPGSIAQAGYAPPVAPPSVRPAQPLSGRVRCVTC